VITRHHDNLRTALQAALKHAVAFCMESPCLETHFDFTRWGSNILRMQQRLHLHIDPTVKCRAVCGGAGEGTSSMINPLGPDLSCTSAKCEASRLSFNAIEQCWHARAGLGSGLSDDAGFTTAAIFRRPAATGAAALRHCTVTSLEEDGRGSLVRICFVVIRYGNCRLDSWRRHGATARQQRIGQ